MSNTEANYAKLDAIAKKIIKHIQNGYNYCSVNMLEIYIKNECENLTRDDYDYVYDVVSTEITIVDCEACELECDNYENCPLANC